MSKVFSPCNHLVEWLGADGDAQRVFDIGDTGAEETRFLAVNSLIQGCPGP